MTSCRGRNRVRNGGWQARSRLQFRWSRKNWLVRAFAVAASGNFPALVLSVFWPRFTTRGAVAVILTGTGGSLVLIGVSPTIMVDVFGAETALFSLKNPAIVTIPAGFLAGFVVSLASPEPAAASAFDAKERRMILGS